MIDLIIRDEIEMEQVGAALAQAIGNRQIDLRQGLDGPGAVGALVLKGGLKDAFEQWRPPRGRGVGGFRFNPGKRGPGGRAG